MLATSRRKFGFGAACLAVAAMFGPAARAENMPKPVGDVVLTIDGSIGKYNADGRADFDLQMLRAFPSVRIQTTTPWTEGVTDFEGVSLEELFKSVAATGKSIKAAALNDYIADVDPATIISSGAILAYRMNGADISVRDKGPLWIMFPSTRSRS